jgi:predicted HicB family RNase H-like nuclease
MYITYKEDIMKKPFHTNLEEELIYRLKIQAAKENKPMNEIIETLIKEYLDMVRGDKTHGS